MKLRKERSKMGENKSKLGLGILIGVLITLVICLGGFIIYDKVLSSNETSEAQENNSTETNNYNYPEIDGIINNYLSHYLNFQATTDGVNLLNSSEGRLELVNSIFMQLKLCNLYETEGNGTIPYVRYNAYKEKYTQLFGNSKDLEKDIKNVIDPIANNCISISALTGNNICWNGTWGTTDNNIVLKSEKVTKLSDTNYKLSGTYTSELNNKKGTFEIEYVKTSNTKYLTSIKLMQK